MHIPFQDLSPGISQIPCIQPHTRQNTHTQHIFILSPIPDRIHIHNKYSYSAPYQTEYTYTTHIHIQSHTRQNTHTQHIFILSPIPDRIHIHNTYSYSAPYQREYTYTTHIHIQSHTRENTHVSHTKGWAISF